MSESNATLTVRVIKSFAYRTVKNVVLRGLDLDQLTVRELRDMVIHGKISFPQGLSEKASQYSLVLTTEPGWKAYQNIRSGTGASNLSSLVKSDFTC